MATKKLITALIQDNTMMGIHLVVPRVNLSGYKIGMNQRRDIGGEMLRN
jgi:hypothetical protein